MRYKEPFVLFKRKLKSGKVIYYYYTYDTFNKRKQYSTGCTKLSDAKRYCLELLLSNSLSSTPDLTFEQYTRTWFIKDECKYIQSIFSRGRSYSRSNAELKRAKLVNKILPYFGKLYIRNITPRHIEEWITIIKGHNLSNVTVNTYISTLATILNEAFRLGDIKVNPIKDIKHLATDSKEKTTLTTEEVAQLLDPANINKYWSKQIYYIFTLLASQTGMRIGEILALQKQDLHPTHIIVQHSWDRKYGIKETKTGKTRIIPISHSLYKELFNFGASHSNSFIFSKTTKDKPIANFSVRKELYKALERMGITKEERVKRCIDFHSWRRYYNTRLLVKGTPVPIIQAIMGHSSDGKMTKHYTKLSLDDLTIVLQ